MGGITVTVDPGVFAPRAEILTSDVFGARYTTYQHVDSFEANIDAIGLGHIVWPGGTLAETRADWFGFGFDGLYNPATLKPDLEQMMSIARDEGTSLSVILPTVRYNGDEATLQTDLQGFLGDLLGGTYGQIPDGMTLEIGSEYYAHFPPATAAADYASLADLMVTEIALALADPGINTIGAEIDIAVQSGHSFAEDQTIRDGLSDFALSETDQIIQHRFAFLPQGIQGRIDLVEDILDAWEADAAAIGEDAPDLNVSAWNVVTTTRDGVLDEYLAANPGLTADDVDLAGRTTTDFERFWQDELESPAYGAEHPGMILEMFHSYAEIGMVEGGVYGVDVQHPGHHSFRGTDGEDYVFVGGEMLAMIYESVEGTQALAADGAFDRHAAMTSYGFESDDKLVLFLAASEDAPGQVTVDVDGLGSTYSDVWAESLTAEINPDWMTLFGIPDNPDVDESEEAEVYASGLREAVTPGQTSAGLTVSMEAHEVLRFAFSKTAAGAADIGSWAIGDPLEIMLPPEEEGDPAAEEEAATSDDDGGGLGSGLASALLLPLLLLL